jgi:hypothetical protein
MEIVFVGERDKVVFIYLNDLNIFSNSDEYHLKHFRQFFIKCKKYGLSLNPKKSHFSMHEGKLLGHISHKKVSILILSGQKKSNSSTYP